MCNRGELGRGVRAMASEIYFASGGTQRSVKRAGGEEEYMKEYMNMR